MIEAVSCGGIVIYKWKILLLYKNQNGRYMGWVLPKGTVEEGETYRQTALREVKEETGLTLTSYRFRGLITFVTDCCETEYMCLYTSDSFEGELRECDEGNLEWVPKERLSGLELWEGDYVFLDLLETRQEFFSLKLCYEKDRLVQVLLDGRKITSFQITKNGIY
mgnify:CR=1 FL=1